jgi:hypothetical protein
MLGQENGGMSRSGAADDFGGRPMIRRLAVITCLAILTSGCQSTAIAIWHMDETSGRAMVDSARDHDGIATNVTFNQPGWQGRAYSFNGVNSVVAVAHASDLNPGGANFAFSARVRFTQPPPPSTFDIVRKGVTTSSGGYWKMELFNGNGGVRAECFWKAAHGRTISAVRGTGLNDNQWHHIVCRRSGNTFSITVDGRTTSNTAELGSIANTAGVTVGQRPGGGDVYKGLMDDVRLTIG